MNILSIETSCDETGISLLDIHKQDDDTHVEIIANQLASQASEHEEYGGIYPTLAKRLHAQNFPALLSSILTTTETQNISSLTDRKTEQIKEWLKRHAEYANHLLELIETKGVPDVDAIAVTVGPGLEPALWVGINTARSLGLVADTPIISTNHMAGHLISAQVPEGYKDEFALSTPELPAVGLLVSGGHTEIIHKQPDGSLEKIGQTRDDAAGEAFDKVGRLLDLPYPAGPEVSRLAEKVRGQSQDTSYELQDYSLPRPMIDSDDLDFSFSGLKTAAAQKIQAQKPLTDRDKKMFAYELESAIVDVLTTKTSRAANQTEAASILAGGGVTANPKLRNNLKDVANKYDAAIHISPTELATDNAIMIGLAGHQQYTADSSKLCQLDSFDSITANSRLSL